MWVLVSGVELKVNALNLPSRFQPHQPPLGPLDFWDTWDFPLRKPSPPPSFYTPRHSTLDRRPYVFWNNFISIYCRHWCWQLGWVRQMVLIGSRLFTKSKQSNHLHSIARSVRVYARTGHICTVSGHWLIILELHGRVLELQSDEMQNLMQPFIVVIAWADRIIVDIDCQGTCFAHFETRQMADSSRRRSQG